MEAYRYFDLFATKGLEYLLVLAFLGALILFWRLLNRPARTLATARPAGVHGAPTPWFRLPEGFFYHQGHSWAAADGPDVFRVGIDDFAQRLIGRPSAVELPRVGEQIRQGEPGWKLRVDAESVPLLSPLEGEVVDVNEEVLKSPALVNADPYGRGWLMKVRVPRAAGNLKNLLSGRLAAAWMEDTVDALRRAMPAPAAATLQDGGEPITGIAQVLSRDRWTEIAADLLRTN